MSIFCPDQGRTGVFGEAYFLYAPAGNPRRTQIRAKKAIYGWKIANIPWVDLFKMNFNATAPSSYIFLKPYEP